MICYYLVLMFQQTALIYSFCNQHAVEFARVNFGNSVVDEICLQCFDAVSWQSPAAPIVFPSVFRCPVEAMMNMGWE